MADIILNTPMLDWLTLTTFDRPSSRAVLQAMNSGIAGNLLRSEARRQTYTGYLFEFGYHGGGEQSGFEHTMANVTGVAAHYLARRIVGGDCSALNCTRLDGQITVKLPAWYDALEFSQQVELQDTRGRAVQLIKNTNGLDTVYVGSRKSDRFARYYVKQGANGRYLRFEVQLKKERAQEIWGGICEGGMIQNGVVHVLGQFQKGYETLPVARLFSAEFDAVEFSIAEVVKGERRTEEWLRSVILKSLVNYAERGDGEYTQASAWVYEASERLKMIRGESND